MPDALSTGRRVLFWVFALLALPTGLLAGLVILLILGGQRMSAPAPDWPALLASAAVLGLLAWAYRLATGGRPAAASAWVVASWMLFVTVMLINGLMHQTLWN